MRKIILMLLALLMLCCPALAEEEDEWSLEDTLAGLDPALVADIVIRPDEAKNAAEDTAAQSIYEEDGSILITITGTGDFTIGGEAIS